jgi:hypothetical protein
VTLDNVKVSTLAETSAESPAGFLVILLHEYMAEPVTLEMKYPFFIQAPELAGGLEAAL